MDPQEPALAQRLRVLEDEREILRTLNQYCHAKDHGTDADELVDVFTETGEFGFSPTGRWSVPLAAQYTGRAELEAWDAKAVPVRATPGTLNKHFTALPRIELDGDRATVETYFIRLEESSDGPVIASMGRYEDLVVRCPDGRWRIQKRHVHREATYPAGPSRIDPA